MRSFKVFNEEGKRFRRLLFKLSVCVLGGRLSSDMSSMLLLSRFNQTKDWNVEKIFGIWMIELSPKNAFVKVSFV